MLDELYGAARSVATAVLPLVVLFLAFQLLLLRLPRRDFKDVLVGTALSAAGLFVFLVGVSVGFLPMGRAIGQALGSLPHASLLPPVGFFIGFVTRGANRRYVYWRIRSKTLRTVPFPKP